MRGEIYKGNGFGRLPNPEEVAALELAKANWLQLPKTKFGQLIIMVREDNGVTHRLVSCGNHSDPRNPNFERNCILSWEAMKDVKVMEREMANRRRWLDSMVHADPLPNEHYTDAQLKEMGLIGLYLWQEVNEEESEAKQ